MLEVLADRTYRHLFAAQVVALLGTGLATVALGLLAYDLAGDKAAMVLGTVFTIKMVAYVGIAPIAGAFANRVNRRAFLVALDLVRAGVAMCLPFVTEVWEVYVLIFLLQSASAAFTPTFQATIPDVLPDEARYTRALSLSRLAYDLENIVSPMLAGLLLAVVSYNSLFLGTVVGFAASAALVVSVLLPSPKPSEPRGIYDRTTRGIRIYLATPRLRGLLALNMAAAAAGAMVLVNSVVLVRSNLGLEASALAWTMFAFGAGSMLAALALPRLLDRVPDRPVMVGGAALMVLTLLALAGEVAARGLAWPVLLGAWLLVGLGYSAVLTPSGQHSARTCAAEVLDLERDGEMGVHLDGSGGLGFSRLEVIEGPSGRRRRTKAERARIAAESMMPGVTVAETARKHGTTRWQIYDWRKQLRKGNLVVPESVASLPVFAELVVDDRTTEASAAVTNSDLEIIVGDIVIRAGTGADEDQLTRAIRAARTAAS